MDTDHEPPAFEAEQAAPPEKKREPLTYTVAEVAQLLGIGRNTAYEAVKRGEIPSIPIGNRKLVPRVAIDHLLNTYKTDAKG